MGVKEVFSVDPFDKEKMVSALKTARNGNGLNVIIAHSPCRVNQVKLGRPSGERPYEIRQEDCKGCALCVRVLGCPGILVTDGSFTIDEELCVGCGLCADVCEQGAIRQVAAETV